MKWFVKYLCVALLATPTLVRAEATMKRMVDDERSVSFGYQPHQVYTVPVHVGYLTQFQFSQMESIVDISSGLDAEAVWETAQPAPHLYNIKPKIVTGDTNVVFTTRTGKVYRTYVFHLKIMEYDPDDATAEPMVWKVKFWYPKAKSRSRAKKKVPPTRPDILSTPERDRNYEYYYSGNKRLVPGVAFDNGTFTFFRFSPDHDWPLIYAVDMNTGNERLVNTRREGPDVIVEGVYDILVLRYGREYACIFNSARVSTKQSHSIKPILLRQSEGSKDAKSKPNGGAKDAISGK